MALCGILRQSTAVDVLLGPMVQATDAAPMTSLTIDVEVSKNGQALAEKSDATAPTHDGGQEVDGYYNCELDTTDTDTVGTLTLVAIGTGALSIRQDYVVVEEAIYDLLFAASATGQVTVAAMGAGTITAAAIATGAIDADAIADNAIDAGAIASNAITDAKIATGAITAAKFAAGAIDAAAIATGAIDADALAADAITAAKLAADVTTELQSGLATAAALADVDTVVDAILVDTAVIGALGAGLTAVPWNADWDVEVQSEVADALAVYDPPTKAELDTAVANVSVDEIQATALADLFNTDSGTTYGSAVPGSVVAEIADNAGGSALTEAGIADAVWEEAQADHVGAGTFGVVASEIADILVDTSTTLQGELDGIQADTEDLQSKLGTPSDLGGGATVAANLADIEAQTDDIGVAGAGLTALATAANLATVAGYLDTEIAAIQAVTDLLPNGGALTSLATQASVNTIDDFLDTEIAAIKAKTDQLTFGVTNKVDANVTHVNETEVTGDGQLGTEWGPA